MAFWNSKKEENVEATCNDRIKRLESKVMRQEAEILDLITAQDILRNKVLRKIQSKRQPEEEEEDDNYKGLPFAKDINSNPFKL